MTRLRTLFSACAAAASAFLATEPADAASLQLVNGWRQAGMPADVDMHIYVPDRVATNPPILVLVHYCGGTAPAVFGQARGVVTAADQYGFIMVVPDSGRCWDVVSNQTRMRDGAGDSHAIRQMVTYALESHDGNPDRVYVTGNSSGGMMTQLLLALYPDVFKAGAAFAGMPAGCRGANETGSGGGYSGACAGGTVTHTPQEWGDIARMLHPGYGGRRPRVQLFHGDMDTIIRIANHTEAIKQWSNVLGLSANPATTDQGVPLGMRQSTRLRWRDDCGQVVLDAFTSLGGDHGPSDALFPANYVVPFLGLDKSGPVDPGVAACGAGGSGGASGAGGSGAGGSAGASGASKGGTAGAAAAGAGQVSGAPSMGGSPSAGSAGMAARAGQAGMTTQAGQAGIGGTAVGGSAGAQGASGSSAGPISGGATGAAGSAGGLGVGGSVGTVTAGSGSTPGGAAGTPNQSGGAPEDGGGCRFGAARANQGFALAALGLGLAFFTRRRRTASAHRRVD